MIKKSTSVLLVSLVLFIIYHYFDSCQAKTDNLSIENQILKPSKPTIFEEDSSSECSDCNKTNSIFSEDIKSKTQVKKVKQVKKENNPLVKTIKKLNKKYGEPSNLQKINGSSVYSWEFLDNQPWNKIIFDYNNNFPYFYYIKAKINNLDEYQKWKKILPNLDFDPKRKSLIIQTKDETTALAVSNIILANLQGKIELNEIIEKQLIPISINRAKKYSMVKSKLKEQLIETINGSSTKGKENILDYSEDLAKETKNEAVDDGPIAGNELYNIPTKHESPLAAMQVSGDSGFSFI